MGGWLIQDRMCPQPSSTCWTLTDSRPLSTRQKLLAKVETVRVVQTDLPEHPAVRAWREMKSSPVEPERIEILKGKSPKQTERFKRLVCRLVDVGPAGPGVIGKRGRRAHGGSENN